jgi:predicted DNA binding protein
MSVVAELTIHSEEFLLGHILDDFPDFSVEIERVVPASGRVMPYIWGHGADLDEFEAAMRATPHVSDVTVLDRLTDSALYKIEWEDPAEEFITGIASSEATILSAHSDDEWNFEIRFDDHAGLADFANYCEDNDINYRLKRVFSLSDANQTTGRYGLTESQHEALTLAMERGYFEIPRDVTLRDLADELGVSVQAVSERLRRAVEKLVQTALAETPHRP